LSLNILVHNNILVSSLGNSKHQSTSEVVIEQRARKDAPTACCDSRNNDFKINGEWNGSNKKINQKWATEQITGTLKNQVQWYMAIFTQQKQQAKP
jgi:hypothetical protein